MRRRRLERHRSDRAVVLREPCALSTRQRPARVRPARISRLRPPSCGGANRPPHSLDWRHQFQPPALASPPVLRPTRERPRPARKASRRGDNVGRCERCRAETLRGFRVHFKTLVRRAKPLQHQQRAGETRSSELPHRLGGASSDLSLAPAWQNCLVRKNAGCPRSVASTSARTASSHRFNRSTM